MSILTLKDRLARYLRKNNDWIASGDIQRIVAEKTTYSPQNVGRRMRELQNEGVVEVKYVKNHAHYRFKLQETWEQKNARAVRMFEQMPG